MIIGKLLLNFKYILLVILFAVIYNSFSEEYVSLWSNIRNCEELNSSEDEFAPVYDKYRNILYFNSSVSKFSYFYQTKFIDSISFDSPKLSKGDLNKINNNQCCLSIYSQDEAYYQAYRNTDKYPVFNIFKLTYLKNSWSSPLLVDTINTDNFTAFPSVANDGSFMVFSSSNTDKSSDIDLYMSFRNPDGNWSIPISIDELNTPGNEISPFIAGNDTLYFSSDGQEGTGRYDIYYSIRDGSQWQRPRPLNELNTEFDETDFKIINDNTAIFCSDRVGGKGKSDIYIVKNESVAQKTIISNQIEISLKTQTLSLQIEKVFEYSVYPIFYRFNSTDIDLLISPEKFNGSRFSTLDSLYINSLVAIANRLSNSSKSKIKVSSNKNEQLKMFFTNKSVDLNQIEFVETYDNIILIDSYSDEISIYSEVGKTEYVINPPALDIIFDARPKEDISSCEIYLIVDEKITKLKDYKGSLPLQFLGKTGAFAEGIYFTDRVSLMAIANDNNGNIKNESLFFNIVREERRIRKYSYIGSNKYEEYFLNYETTLNSEKSNFNSIIQKIKESATFSKSVAVEYFDDSTKLFAENLSKYLGNLKIGNIKLQKSNETNNHKYKNNFNKLFRILIEKY